jgi:hypothetical protein
VLYLMKTALHYCKDPNLAWDPRNDIVFLCQSYGQDLEAIRSSLNPNQLYDCIFERTWYKKLSTEDQRTLSMTLLGKELLLKPPPKMAITPPRPSGKTTTGQSGTASGQGSVPTLQSHKSTPNLGRPTESSSQYLAPPLPGKPRPKPSDEPKSRLLSTGAAKQMTVKQVGPQAQAQVVPVYSAGADSRSRYRAISAPNTPGHARHSSLNAVVGDNGPRSRSAERQGASQPFLNVPGSQATHTTSPRAAVGNGPAPATAPPKPLQPQKSMPNLTAAKATSHRTSKTVLPNLNGVPSLPPIQPHSPFAVPGVNHHENRMPIQAHHQKQPNNVGYFSAGHNVVSQIPRGRDPGPAAYTRLSESVHNNNAHPSTNGPHSINGETGPRANSDLKIVGPQGLHLPIQKPSQQPGPPTGGHVSAPPNQPISHPPFSQQKFIFELDATVPTPKPRHDSKAPSPEISPIKPHSGVDLSLLSNNTIQHPQTMNSQSSSSGSIQELPAEPVVISPPAATPPMQAQQAQFPGRPMHPRNHSDPNPSLPASLVAGGAARQRPSQGSVSLLQPPPLFYNAQRYNSNYEFYSNSPPKEDNTGPPASNAGSQVVSLYQAYQAYPGSNSSPPAPAASQQLITTDKPMVMGQMVHSPQQTTPSTSTTSTPTSSPFSPSSTTSTKSIEVRRPFPNPLMANPPTPALPPDSHTEVHDLHLGSRPSSTSTSDVRPKVPNSPPLITQGYQRFAHGPYTPSPPPSSAGSSSTGSGKVRGFGGAGVEARQKQMQKQQQVLGGEAPMQMYQAYPGMGSSNVAPTGRPRGNSKPRYYGGPQ